MQLRSRPCACSGSLAVCYERAGRNGLSRTETEKGREDGAGKREEERGGKKKEEKDEAERK